VIRTWFVRDVLEAIERERGGTFERLLERLPERLHGVASIERLRSSGPLDTTLLDEAEELLLSVDNALGDGSGRVLESAAAGIFARALSQPGSAVRGASLMGTMARLRAAFERPFIRQDLVYELIQTDTGFALAIGVPGRPRCARLLKSFAVGAVKIAHRTTRGADSDEIKIFADTQGDRARITVFCKKSRSDSRLSDPEDLPPVPPSRRPSRPLKSQPNLAAQVERILRSHPLAVDAACADESKE
jgi:hypothetical protein